MASPEALVHVSAATIWEVSLKAALGKIDLRDADLVAEIAANRFVELPITSHHARAAAGLPRHHDDPFDRMLIAQARLEGLTLVSRDSRFQDYEVAVVWA